MNPASVDLEAFAVWLERAGTSPHTRRAYLRLMQGFVGFLQESGRDISAVLADEHERTFAARDWRQQLRHVRRLAPASVNQALAALHTYCQFACLSVPNVKREDLPQLAPRALDESEQKRLLRAIERTKSVRDRAIAYTLFYTGLRIAEVAALDMADVVVSDRRGKLIVRKGKGDRQREAPLHPVAREAMLMWLRERRERWGEPQNAGVGVPCFLSYQGKRLSARSIDKLMDRLGEEAAIEGLSAHVLRHTFTTNLIRAGQDLVLVAELTGHARLETVRRYSLPTERDKEQATARLPMDQ